MTEKVNCPTCGKKAKLLHGAGEDVLADHRLGGMQLLASGSNPFPGCEGSGMAASAARRLCDTKD